MNWSRPRNGPRAESTAATAVALVGRALGWVTHAEIGPCPATNFIWSAAGARSSREGDELTEGDDLSLGTVPRADAVKGTSGLEPRV